MEQTVTSYPDRRIHQEENPSQAKEVVVFVGPEGSGKTSQAKLLGEALGLPLLIYGDVFRRTAADDKTSIGEECRSTLEAHKYLGLSLVQTIISRELSNTKYKNGVIIDGAFRIDGEVDTFEDLLKKAGINNCRVTIFFLRIPGWKSFERAGIRGRKDDSTQGVQSRLGTFYKDLGKRMSQVKEMENKGNWRFISLNALKSIDEVAQGALERFNGD